MLRNIKYSVHLLFIVVLACNENDSLIETENPLPAEAVQVGFLRNLKHAELINYGVDSLLSQKVIALCKNTRFANRVNINTDIDSTKLNFFFINTARDSTLKNICAFIGLNTILLDDYFLMHFFDDNPYFRQLNEEALQSAYSSFQSWVIGHEIAHADLHHPVAHFLSFKKPVDSKEGFKFHHLEIEADEQSLKYYRETNLDTREKMWLLLFQSEYDNIYGIDSSSANKYLRYYDEFGLQRPYSFRGTGSHPLMMYRSALLLLLTSQNETIKNEAYNFLIEINAFSEVRKWKPAEHRNIKITAFHLD